MDTSLEEKVQIKIAPLKMYDIIFFNDDFTPMDFVVELLTSVFNHNLTTATDLMIRVHEHGHAIVGTFFFEIANEKRNMCLAHADKYGFPLKVEMEISDSEA